VSAVIRDLLRPWREATTWWSLTHVLLDVVVGTVAFTVTVVLLATGGALLITFPLALPVIWALFVGSRMMAAAERSRIATLLGEAVADPVPPLASRNPWGRLVERARSGDRWREIAYHLLALPRGVFTTVVAMTTWGGAVALLFLPLYVRGLPATPPTSGGSRSRRGRARWPRAWSAWPGSCSWRRG
jgi:hypothetical protein